MLISGTFLYLFRVIEGCKINNLWVEITFPSSAVTFPTDRVVAEWSVSGPASSARTAGNWLCDLEKGTQVPLNLDPDAAPPARILYARVSTRG